MASPAPPSRCRRKRPRPRGQPRGTERQAGSTAHCLTRALAINRADLHEKGYAMLPTAAAPSGETARITARILLEIEAVLFRPDNPFILTSGRASPVYI